MGKVGRSWALVKESFRVLRSDKQLMLLPILSAISCIVVTLVICGGGGLAFYPAIKAAVAHHQQWHLSPGVYWVGLFIFYAANYFVIVFFNTALVGAASVQLNGGAPTLKDGLRIAWEHKEAILGWACLAATVGVILRMIENRLKFVGWLAAKVIGIAWTLASFFVIPLLALEDLGPVDALKRSAELFRKTWGEQVVGGISFGLIFFLLSLPGLALPVLGAIVAGGVGAIVGLALMILYFLFLAVVSSAVQGIYIAALYRYAKSGQVAPGFSQQNFAMAWRPK